MRKHLLSAALLSLATALAARAAGFNDDDFSPPNIPQPTIPDHTLEAKAAGLTGDGSTNDTPAFNKAIEQLAAQGGGTLHFAAGKYMLASAHLASNIRLLLDNDATLEGLKTGYEPPEPNPYNKFQDIGHSHFHDAVFYGDNLQNFAIEGGNFSAGGAVQGNPKPDGGDKLFAITRSKNLSFKNTTFPSCGHFAFLLNDCENITIDHVTTKKSRDVIDLMGCRNVAVHDCHFTGASDDTLGIKSDYALGRRILTENIYAWDNYFESGCNGLQFGSETAGDFKHIRCWNITIGRAMKAGIGITCNDSAHISDVRYKNIKITGAANPIYILITDRLRTGEKGVTPGSISDISIQDVSCTDMAPGRQGPVNPVSISALPNYPISNLTISNLTLAYPGGGDAHDADITPPYPKDYSPRSLGPRPCSAFFIRHAHDLTLKNISISWDKPDGRPPFVLNDVSNLTLQNITLKDLPKDQIPLKLENAKNITAENVTNLNNGKLASSH
ncbi:MAG: glycoside hydrolase family 28 protein [Phycisphaerae bacterium]